jgi:hypothetical protein
MEDTKNENYINTNQSNNFKYKHTILLYLVYEGYKKGVITSDEKRKIKELILINHPIIFEILKKYEQNGKIEDFWTHLKDLMNNSNYEIDSSSMEIIKNSESESDRDINKGDRECLSSTLDMTDINAELSSPSDSALIRQKKIKRDGKKIEKEFREKSEEASMKENDSRNLNKNKDTNVINWIKICDQGCSPITAIKKRYNNDEDFY